MKSINSENIQSWEDLTEKYVKTKRTYMKWQKHNLQCYEKERMIK